MGLVFCIGSFLDSPRLDRLSYMAVATTMVSLVVLGWVLLVACAGWSFFRF